MFETGKLIYEAIENKIYWHNLVRKGYRSSSTKPMEPMTEPIDFVVTWVDGSDTAWKTEKEQYEKNIGGFHDKHANGEERYRDWNLFQYWFRAVEKYAPWVRNIYLVTWGHVPGWLNLDAPKLKIVKHRDFIPERFLPTFSSNPIELNLHRIKGLSEHFVYFNDDVFLTCPVEPEDFFRGGKPNCTAITQPLVNDANSTFNHMLFTVYGAINTRYCGEISKKIIEHPELWFSAEYGNATAYNLIAAKNNWLPGVIFPHLAVPFRKSDFEKAWEAWPELMEDTSSHMFRTAQDTFHFLVTLYCMMEGNFNAVSLQHHGEFFWNPSKQEQEVVNAIMYEKYRAICINDSPAISAEEFLKLKASFSQVMTEKFPQKSCFEKVHKH